MRKKEKREVRHKKQGQTNHVHSLMLLSPQILQRAITKQTLIKLGFVACRVLQFIIKSSKTCAGSQWTEELTTDVMTVERQVNFIGC